GVDSASGAARLVNPAERDELPFGRDEETDAGSAGRSGLRDLHGLADRGVERELGGVEVKPRAADLGVVTAAEPGSELHDPGAVVGEAHLGVGGAVLDPERF